MSEPYSKIDNAYKRDPKTFKMDPTNLTFAYEAVQALAGCQWDVEEKIDGTNIRVLWDGDKPEVRGRTDRAQRMDRLWTHIEERFPEEILEQCFAATPATLYGEGYGQGVQSGIGEKYLPDSVSFRLFDVKIGSYWLSRENVKGVAKALGCDVAPSLGQMSLYTATSRVAGGLVSLCGTGQFAEGVICRAPFGLLDRHGKRLMVKIKHRDLYQEGV